MSIGVSIFLMVLGAILAFAVKADTPGINVNVLGIILLLIGVVSLLYTLLFWSSYSPLRRRRGVRRRTVLEERPGPVVPRPPTEVIDEPPIDPDRP